MICNNLRMGGSLCGRFPAMTYFTATLSINVKRLVPAVRVPGNWEPSPTLGNKVLRLKYFTSTAGSYLEHSTPRSSLSSLPFVVL